MLVIGVSLAFLTLATVNCRPNFAYNQSVPYTNLQSESFLTHRPDEFKPLDIFMSYNETIQWMAALEAKYPDKCKVEPIGRSYEGRDINAMVINKQPSKKVFVVANMHAREWAAMTSAIYIIHELILNSNNYPEASTFQWIVVPLPNPDGYMYTRLDRLWRKNRAPQQDNATGVDLNRNFAYKWELNLNEEDDDPHKETYRGPSAFSELESRTISDYLNQNSNSIVLYVDLQTFGEYILIPWSYTKDSAPNTDFLMSVAHAGAKAIISQSYEYYVIGTLSDLAHPVSGSSMDYCYFVGVKACIIILLTNEEYEIAPSTIIPYGQIALAAVQAMAVKAGE
uniref:Peptidase_M14 domain-containing protein n=1 Tax=Anopheles gambiae TaxID=7165 RepID=A0A1S4HFG4_ANOGA